MLCYPENGRGAGFPAPLCVEMCVEVVESLKMRGFWNNEGDKKVEMISVHNAEGNYDGLCGKRGLRLSCLCGKVREINKGGRR